MTGVSHADPRFLNDLLNSSYIAELSDPANRLEGPNLGAVIVAAHVGDANALPDILDAAFDAVLAGGESVTTTLDAIDLLPLPQAPAHLDFHGNAGDDAINRMSNAEPNPAPRTYEETELEMLKVAVLNPDLYNNLKQVFTEHKYPEKLDTVGQQLREFFLNQKG